MAEEPIVNPGQDPGAEPGGSDKNYLEEIKKLKENSVSKDEYNKVLEENKKLLEKYINGEIEEPTKVQEKVDKDALRKDIFSGNLTNLDCTKKTLELRKAIMDEGGLDPFLPKGREIVLEDSDYVAAQRVAEGLQHCVEVANGDPALFTQELQRIMVDTAPVRRK